MNDVHTFFISPESLLMCYQRLLYQESLNLDTAPESLSIHEQGYNELGLFRPCQESSARIH